MSSSSLPPPPDGDVSRGPSVLAASTVMFAASFIATVLRILVRWRVVRHFGWDDFFIVLAAALNIPALALNYLAVQSGIGRHLYYLTADDVTTGLKWSQLSRLFFVLVTFFTKVSICLFLIRIPEDKRLTRLLWVTIALFTAANIAWIVEYLAQCRPIAGLWDSTLKGVCWDPYIEVDFDYMQGALAVTTDLILSLSPIVFLWNIRISMSKKIMICGLMATGLLATACTCVRIALAVVNAGTKDQTWEIVPDTIWSIMELDIALLVANLPAMFPGAKIARTRLSTSYIRLVSWSRRMRPSAPSDRGDGDRPHGPAGDAASRATSSSRPPSSSPKDFSAGDGIGTKLAKLLEQYPGSELEQERTGTGTVRNQLELSQMSRRGEENGHNKEVGIGVEEGGGNTVTRTTSDEVEA